FRCPDFESFDKEKCHLFGKMYNPHDIIDMESLPKKICVESCFCGPSFGAEYPAQFNCHYNHCFEQGAFYNKPCVFQRSFNTCCAENIVCDEQQIKELHQCYYNDRTYREGEIIDSIQSCYDCICNPDFHNETDVTTNPSCEKKKDICNTQLHDFRYYQFGCVPIYYGKQPEICPTDYKCPKESDQIVEGDNSDREGSCKFGKLIFRKDKTSARAYLQILYLQMLRRDEEQLKMNANGDPARCNNDNDDLFYDGPRSWKFIVKHWPTISQPLALFFIIVLSWGLAYMILPANTTPNAVIMRMIFLFAGAQMCGQFVTLLRLPDTLGMLFWGVFYTNIGLGNFHGYQGLEPILRELALVNIMLLAGLGLDLDMLKKVFGMVMRLTLIPSFFEVAAIAVLSHVLLKLPLAWGSMLGLVLTAISSNIIEDVLLKLKEKRFGLNKDIHTLIIAVTSCNNIVAIFLFGISTGIVFSQGPFVTKLLQGPIGFGIGIVYGFLYGLLLCFLPSKKSKYSNGLRFTMMLLGGLFSVMASKFIGFPSAGLLGCITIAFVARICWKRRTGIENIDIAVKMDLLWKFLKPISFALIGKEVDFIKLNGKVVAVGISLLFVGCVFRLVFSYFSAFGGDLNWKERAYVTISGFPKSTVQAALGPIALDMARQLDSEKHIAYANIILVVSVLAITFTAPLGAVLMTKLAPSWLQKSPPPITVVADCDGA
ncbi:Sodium/hydrogen exchanger 9B2, partial [Pseudolycoriella hygida]